MRIKILILAMSMLLAGCAGGMSKDECLYADWRAIGYEDGARGASATAVSPRRQACANKAGVTVDMESYLAGRDEGLEEYCQPAKAFSVGAAGGRYYGVCSGPEEDEFLNAFQSGNQLYILKGNASAAANRLYKAEHRLTDLRHSIDEAELALISPATPHLERVDILVDLKNMREEHERIAASLGPLAYDVERAEEELADYRAYLATEGVYQSVQPLTRANY